MIVIRFAILFACLSLLFQFHLSGAEVQAQIYQKPDQCKTDEYFDTLSLSCVPCTKFAQIAHISSNNSQTFLENDNKEKTACACKTGYRLNFVERKFRCIKIECVQDQIYLNGKCGYCTESNNNGCNCSNGQFLQTYSNIDRATNKTRVEFQCTNCPFSSDDCVACHPSYLLASNGFCQCPESSHVEEDGVCIEQKSVISHDVLLSHSTIRYASNVYTSRHLYHIMPAAIYNCNNNQNQTACQLLLNWCSLKYFTELSNQKDSHNAKEDLCQFIKQLNTKLEYGVDWYYVSDHQETTISDKHSANDIIQMESIVYKANGQLVRLDQFNLQHYFFCHLDSLRQDKLLFGVNVRKTCTWSARQLWNYAIKRDNFFHEVYFVSNELSKLYPVPVKVTFGKTSNQLFKRFFLTNTQIGVDLITGNEQFIIYAKSVTIEFQISKFSTNGKIYPPVIKIKYESLDQNIDIADYNIETDINVVYQMNDDHFKYNLGLTISILGSFAALWSLFRTWCWMRRSGRYRVELCVLGMLVIKSISYISNVFILVCLLVTITQFIVFKYQSKIHIVLLTPTQASTIFVYLIVAYGLKLIQLLNHILTIASVDIFFIDWEKPRKMSDKLDKISVTSNKTADSVKSFPDNVSIWRSNFVVNEWFELSVQRRINISIHIFVLVLFLECSDCKYLTRISPQSFEFDSKNIDEIPESSLTRLALASVVYITLALAQYLYQKYFNENFGYNKFNEFIDLCSVSNISVFCLKYKRYGCYLHGLSPNGRSDVNMLEMYKLLEIEESDLCSKRGLLPNTDQQIFEMFIPAAVHDHWIKLRKSIESQRQNHLSFSFMRHLNQSTDKETLVRTYYAINKFLSNFIEHNFQKGDYIVQEKSSLESLLDFEFTPVNEMGHFYSDKEHSFEGVLLYGIEFTITTFELMTFLMIDLMFRNFLIAGIGTYLASKLIKQLFSKIYRKNLVLKTLMDERFLI